MVGRALNGNGITEVMQGRYRRRAEAIAGSCSCMGPREPVEPVQLATVVMALELQSSGFIVSRAIEEPAGDVLVKDAADQGLVRDTLLHGTDA